MASKGDKEDIERFYKPYQKFESSIGVDIAASVKALNTYKDFVKAHSKFSAQSKFAPTIIEEFLCRVLKARFGNHHLSYGSVKAYSSLYFTYSGADSFKHGIDLRVNVKDQDVGIYKEETLTTADGESHTIYIPLVCIECKTYLDKTMYEGAVATATKIKTGNPYCLFFIVTETYDVKADVEIASQIDNIYILRKRRRKASHQPIQSDVIQSLIDEIDVQFKQARKPVDQMISERGFIRAKD